MKKSILYLVFTLFCIGQVAMAQNTATVIYQDDQSIFLNPERGFYTQISTHADPLDDQPANQAKAYLPLNTGQLDNIKAKNESLILRLFYLHQFYSTDVISQQYLDNIEADFNILRASGMKAVVRFAYSSNTERKDLGITTSRIQAHLQQLKPILEANKDVILVIQAGLIGAYGEWYYTDNFGDNGQISEQDYVERFKVIDALLDAVPKMVQVQLRAPFYKTKYLQYKNQSTAPITTNEAYDTTLIKSRLGHHNDCLLSSPDGHLHEITIPKASLGTLASTINIGYRGLDNNDALVYGSPFSQTPPPTGGLAPYQLGSAPVTGGSVNWSNVPRVVPQGNGSVPQLRMADDANNLYILLEEDGYLVAGKKKYQIFLNTDNNANTGFVDASAWTEMGAEILIERLKGGIDFLFAHQGPGNGFSWNPVSNPGIINTVTPVDKLDDQGTYTFPPSNGIAYVAADTKYTMAGGETCAPTNLNDCVSSVMRLQAHHYTYLNSGYRQEVINKWDSTGCLEGIKRNLGYRLSLNELEIQKNSPANKSIFVSLTLTNQGYSAPVADRPLQLVLRDSATSVEYKVPFTSANADVRFWQPGAITVNESLDLSLAETQIPQGTYRVLLNLPDASASLRDTPAYSIRFANQGTWEAGTGYNDLNATINIGSTTTGGGPVSITVDGNTTDWDNVDTIGLGNGNITGIKAHDDNDTLYLLATGSLSDDYIFYIDADGRDFTGFQGTTRGADYKIEGGKLFKHEFKQDWVSIADTVAVVKSASALETSIPKALLYGLGTKVGLGYEDRQGTTVMDALPQAGNLLEYAIKVPITVPRPAITITADGGSSDWAFVPSIASTEGNLGILKAFDDNSNIYLLVRGDLLNIAPAANTIQVFFNTDGDKTTGLLDGTWSEMGADYAIIGNTFYKHKIVAGDVNGFNWDALSTIYNVVTSADLKTREISIPKAALNTIPAGAAMDIGYRNLINNVAQDKIPNGGPMAPYVLENGLVNDLETISVADTAGNVIITVTGNKLEDTYDLLINTDNKATTGFADASWTAFGADYLVQNGSLFSYSGTGQDFSWSPIGPTSVIDTVISPLSKQRKFTLEKTAVNTLTAGDTIAVGYRNTVNFTPTAQLPTAQNSLLPYVLTTAYQPALSTIAISDDADFVIVQVEGAELTTAYQGFVNADGDTTTGYADASWSPMGADFLIENGNLFSYNGDGTSFAWNFIGSVMVTNTMVNASTSQRTLDIPKTALGDLANEIFVGYRNLKDNAITAQLPESGPMKSYSFAPIVQGIGEVGSLTVGQAGSGQWQSVALVRSYTNPVIIMGPLSFNDSDPATVRVKNVTATGFKFQIDEWDYLDGAHLSETLSYLVVEAGTYSLDGGVVLQAGTTAAGTAFSPVAFNQAYMVQVPLVFSQVLTVNDTSAVTTRQRFIGNSSFDLKIQEEENADGVHAAETVGWLALSEGFGNADKLYEVDGTSRNYDHIFFENYFVRSYANPRFFANMLSAHGDDASVVRYKNLSSTRVFLKVEEEQSKDTETGHTNEEIGYLVFDGDGIFDGTPIVASAARAAETLNLDGTKVLDAAQVKLYPNPTKERLNLDFAKRFGFTELLLMDFSGKEILRKTGLEDSESFDISRLVAGIYVLRLLNASGTSKNIKFIKK